MCVMVAPLAREDVTVASKLNPSEHLLTSGFFVQARSILAATVRLSTCNPHEVLTISQAA